jgi:hypothetical protein
VPRRVDDDVVALARFEESARGVDGNALGLLILERVEQEGVLEGARTDSSFPSGKDPVSASSRPTTVLLPWSTCPTMTMFMRMRLSTLPSLAAE